MTWVTRNEAMALIGAESVEGAAKSQILLAHLTPPDRQGAGPSALYSREAVECIAEELRAKEMSKALGTGPSTGLETRHPNDRCREMTYGPGLKVGDLAYVDKYGNARRGDDPDEYCPTARVSFADKDGWVILEAIDDTPF